MASVKGAWVVVAASAIGVLMTACGGSSGTGTKTTTNNPVTPTVTVTAPASMVVGASFSVTVAVTGSAGTPTGSITLSSGSFSYSAGTLSNGSVTVSVPANTWNVAAGTYTLTASYTPDTNSSSTYNSATGVSSNITVTAAPPTTYALGVNSTNPASGVTITASPADITAVTGEPTPAAFDYDAGTTVTLTAPATAGGNAFASWSGCASTNGYSCTVTMNADTTVTVNYTVATGGTAVLTVDSVNPASNVTIQAVVQGTSTNVGAKTPFSITGTTGTQYVLTAPSAASGNSFGAWTGCTSTSGVTCNVTLSADTTLTATYALTPTVTVTPQSNSVASQDSLQVTVAVSAPSGDLTPEGLVVLSYGTTWSSAAKTLTSGSATITVPAEKLPSGSDTLTATYTPGSTSVGVYGTATGTSSAVTVGSATAINVDQASVRAATTNQILGVNLESWYDVVDNASTITSALDTTGMTAMRWPGGSWSDGYHWGYQTGSGSLVTPYNCTCTSPSGSNPNVTTCTANSQNPVGNVFSDFETDVAKGGTAGFDLALTADYGVNEACNGGGDPNEAAAWAAAAVADGHPASHITIGNEVYGTTWENDLHAKEHDPTTYADAVIGTSGYYESIKNAVTNAGGNANNTLVGVVVDANCTAPCAADWDTTMLPLAKGYFDFVEFHYYPQYQTPSTDTYLVHQAAVDFTTDINTVKNELASASVGEPNTPIYVGEVGGNSADPVKQSWSITQALYAGQMLGEAMNDGISRMTWWDGFDNCFGANPSSPSESGLYGWQGWGAQDIFSAGSADTSAGCTNDGAAGTLSPTAQAFNLFKNVAVPGENVLTATVNGGDTTDVKAYAATHSGGTALVLFNLNATTAEPVEITLSSATSTTDMQLITYDKEIYDYTNVNCQADSVSTFTPYPCTYDSTHNYSTIDWAGPTTTDLGSTPLPYTLVLQPWSMNVVIIKSE